MKPLIPSGSHAAFAVCSLACAIAPVQAGEVARKGYDIARGDAASTLKRFADESGRQVVFLVDAVRGVTTNPVRGEYTVREALTRLVADTGLVVVEDVQSGALLVNRAVIREPLPAKPEAPKPTATMKSRTLFAALAGWLAASTAVEAQTVAAPPPEEPLVLSPFTVTTEKDTGFVAASSLAGGRLSSALKDTPADYSVLTRDFLDALNVNNLSDAIKWTVNATNIVDDNSGALFTNGASNNISIRGAGSNGQQIDFFQANYDFDSYSLERLDFARGANAVLFGSGSSFSGTPNGVLKRARTDRSFNEARFTAGSWNFYRATFDINQRINDKLAARMNLVWQDSQTWRDREFTEKRAIALASTYKPWRKTSISLSSDIGRFDRNIAQTNIIDQFSGWDGKTTYATAFPDGTAPTNANALGVTRLGSNTSPYLVYNTALGGNTIMNYANWATTRSGAATVGPGGVPIAGVFTPAGVADTGLSGVDILNTIGRPAGTFDNAIAGSKFRMPSRSFTITPNSGRNLRQDYKNYTITLNQQIGESFFIEGAANYTDAIRIGDNTNTQGLVNTLIDINQNNPDGSANPNFLQPYNDSPVQQFLSPSITRNQRLALAYALDKTRLGDFRVSVMGGSTHQVTQTLRSTFAVKDPLVDSRLWSTTNLPRFRYYWNQAYRPDPRPNSMTVVNRVATSTTALPGTYRTGWAYTPNGQNVVFRNTDYVQAALTARLFKGRLNLLTAARRDAIDIVTRQSWASSTAMLGELPANYDGYTVIYRPAAPADYATLSFIPKDSTGRPTGAPTSASSRPRNADGSRQAQYANDRFQDDYSAPRVRTAKTVFSHGAVLHMTNWLSGMVSYGESFLAPGTAPRIDFSSLPPIDAQTTSYGLRINLPDNRLSLSISKYKGTLTNVNTNSNDGISLTPVSIFNNIVNANKLGDFSSDGINQRGLTAVPSGYQDLADRKIDGTELEIVANPTRSLRVLANIAFPHSYSLNGLQDTRKYIAKNEATLKDIVLDSGAVIDAANFATNPGGLPAGNEATTAANAWNQLQDLKKNIVTGQNQTARLGRYSANIFADYGFREGKLKGLKIGAGANFRGKEIIGFRGADTMRNPTDPTRAIDNPAVDAKTPVYNRNTVSVTSTLGYEFKVARNYTVLLNLRIDNVLNDQKSRYFTTVQRIASTDLSDPSRVATPSSAAYIRPRNYEFSATVRF